MVDESLFYDTYVLGGIAGQNKVEYFKASETTLKISETSHIIHINLSKNHAFPEPYLI